MKRSLAALLVVGITVCNTLAQVDVGGGGGGAAQAVKERAKRTQNANNTAQGVQPGVPPPAAAAPAAPTAAPPPATKLDPAQQALVDKVQTDVLSIKADTTATPDQEQRLQTDLLGLSKGPTKPSKELMAKLSADLATALSGKNVVLKDPAQFSRALNIVMNNSHVTAVQALAFVNLAQNSLKSGGVPEAEAKVVGADLKAIVTELQKSKPSLYQ